ncbi:MAG TPA: hypothetical protein VGN48_02075 [Pedococcus sp.]|nr:hypothetical protein [Pedococcus sp.]
MSIPRVPRGLLLVSGDPTRAAAWVRRGLVACYVMPFDGWTAIVPAEPASRAKPPYDDPVTLLASRPVPHRLRPALGFWATGGRAVATVTPRGWRTGLRWLVWQPGEGAVRAPGLRLARIADLAVAAGRPGSRAEVGAVVTQRRGDPDTVLADLMAVLRLPGSGLLIGGLPRGDLRGALRPGSPSANAAGPEDVGFVVEPALRGVMRFDAQVGEDARHRAELEEL